MTRAKRLAKRAKALRNKIERRAQTVVRNEPKLIRLCQFVYKATPAVSPLKSDPIAVGYPGALLSWLAKKKATVPHVRIVGVIRLWLVNDPDLDERECTYDNIIEAKGHRDGLNYHWARHLMTQGTPAAGM